MAHTRRNNNKYRSDKELRTSKPYKRQRKNTVLSEFEISYIESNRSPQIILS